jgi:hypothetical protein
MISNPIIQFTTPYTISHRNALMHVSLTNISMGTRHCYLSISVGLVSMAVFSMILTFVNPEKYLEDFARRRPLDQYNYKSS